MDKENGSDSEEEYLVYMEFQDKVNIDQYKNVHVLGINGKQPIVQMDDTFFIGKYDNPLGTYMFFEEDPTPHCADPLFDRMPESSLKYTCKTRKFIKLENAYVSPKEGEEQKFLNQSQQSDDDIEPVNFKTIQEAMEKFKGGIETNQASDIKEKKETST